MEYENESPEPQPAGKSSFGDISLLRTYFRMEDADPLSIIEFCQNYGLLGTQYICPLCAQPMKLASRTDICDKICWSCSCNGRRTKRSIRNGTWFAKSNIPIPKILMMTCCWVSKAPLGFISHQCEVSPTSVTNWISFCREICFQILVYRTGKLGGPGSVVELDELKFVNNKNNQAKKGDGQWVFTGYERGKGHCFFEPVEQRTPEILLAVISERVLPGTTVMSNFWDQYDAHGDFQHLKVNNNLIFVDLDDKIKGTWSAIKQKFCSSKKQFEFDYNFAEHVWIKSSTSPVEKMLSFFKTCAELYPPQVQDCSKPE